MGSVKYEQAAITTLMTTELNSLANNAKALGTTVYANGTNQYLFGYFELVVDYGTSPTAGSLIELYIIPTVDGTNYVDGDASNDPAYNLFAGGFAVRATTNPMRLAVGGPGGSGLVALPPTSFKALLWNKTGQAFAASANTLKMIPYRYQTT